MIRIPKRAARIVGARWTPRVNVLTIRCGCGREFPHRADRWRAPCPRCGRRMNLREVRAADPELGGEARL